MYNQIITPGLRPKELMHEFAKDAKLRNIMDTRKPKPGELYARLSQEQKDLLKQLKSSDVENVRWPIV